MGSFPTRLTDKGKVCKKTMIAYIMRRLLLLPVVVFGCIIVIFLLMHLLSPYERIALYISSPAELQAMDLDILVERYGLNQPAYKEFARWVMQLAHGELGWSESASRPVVKAFARFLPVSAELGMWSMLPIVLGGILLGSLSAVRHNRPIDHLIRLFAVTGWSIPPFAAGLFGLFLFYGLLVWFPPGRIGFDAAMIVASARFNNYTGILTLDAVLNWNWFVFASAIRHLILPVLTLSYVSWAMLLRVTRASMLEELKQDYVTTARGKGLREPLVIYKHALRNALIPSVTIAGMTVAILFGGLVVTETVFDLHGLGRWAAEAARTFDIPALVGYLLFNGSIIVIVNLVVDVLYACIDPRVRLQ